MTFKQRLKEPATVYKILISIFLLGMTWSTLSMKVDTNSDRLDKIDALHLEATMMQMQTDIAWIRKALESHK